MKNLKDYSDLIHSLVKEADASDDNWKWSVHSVSKTQVKIRWGYLDYMEEKENCFFITLSDNYAAYEDSFLGARTPDFGLIHSEIVTENPVHFWQETFEKAIKSAVNAITDYAHSRY